MSDQHRATTEQWAYAADRTGQNHFACILELRARVEALEAKTATFGAQPIGAIVNGKFHRYSIGPAKPIEAQPGGLVERVAEAMQPGTFDWSAYEPEARAAIRAVAAWLRTGRLLHAAELLEQELGNG